MYRTLLLLALAVTVANATSPEDDRAAKNYQAIVAGKLKPGDLTKDEQRDLAVYIRGMMATNVKIKKPACREAHQRAESAVTDLSSRSRALLFCAEMSVLSNDCSMEFNWVRNAQRDYENAVRTMKWECNW